MSCDGCKYNGLVFDDRRNLLPCRHPDADRPEFWADPTDYSCHTPDSVEQKGEQS